MCLLTWLKIYTPPVIYIIFSIEVVYLIYLFLQNITRYQSTRTVKYYYFLFRNYLSTQVFSYKIIFIISCIFILFFISLIPLSAGTSYYFIDAVNHWTRWPVQWATNNFPIGTAHYPQLFPANLSLIYVFTGEPSYQFFPKLIMPLFFIGNLLIYFDIAISHKSKAELTGLIIYGMILLIFYSVLFILEVNADIPVSFFSFLTFYTIIRNEDDSFNIKTIVLVTIFATSAALTKLAGLYILTLAELWIIYIFYKNRNLVPLRLLIQTGAYLILILFGGIFWYLVRPVEMLKGLDQSPYLVAGYYTRFINAVKLLMDTLGLPFLIFLTITITASLLVRETKRIVLLIIIPAVILWAFFFSADYRNLSFAIPFIAYASGYGLWETYNKIFKFKREGKALFPNISFEKHKFLFSFLIILLLILAYTIAGTDRIFNAGINTAYNFHIFFSGNYRLNYFTEIGYYRYVEYIVNAFRLLCVGLLILFIIKNLSVKIFHLFVFILVISTISGFSLLNKDKLWEMQIRDKEMVKIHNIYYKIYSFLNNSGQSSLIILNDIQLSRLIPPNKVEFQYLKEVYPGTINQQNRQYNKRFLLLEKGKLSAETLSYLSKNKAAKNFKICFEDEEFIFLLKEG